MARNKINRAQLRKIIKESIREVMLNEDAKTKIASYLKGLTKDVYGIKSMNDLVRADLIGLGLPAIEQTQVSSPAIAELVDNLLILKQDYSKGTALGMQSEEVQAAVDYLSSKESLEALNLITDIDAAMEAALAAGKQLQGGSSEKIYTATSFPDGLFDSEFYKKSVADGWKFILKPYVGNRRAQSLPVDAMGFAMEQMMPRVKGMARKGKVVKKEQMMKNVQSAKKGMNRKGMIKKVSEGEGMKHKLTNKYKKNNKVSRLRRR